MNGHIWTDERIERLKELWADGLSCAEISRALGQGISRCAVIGKVHRLALSREGKPTQTHRGVPKGPKASKPIAIVIPALPDPEPHLRVKLMDLAHNHCRFPIGDPQEADFGFCGREKFEDRVYCADHCARAYPNFVSGPDRAHVERGPSIRSAVTADTEQDLTEIIGEAA